MTGDLVSIDQPKDALLLSALLEGKSIKAAAEIAEMSESTARRRLRDDAFARDLADACRQIVVAAHAGLVGLAESALGAYRAVLEDASAPATARIHAARDVFEGIAKLGPLVEQIDMADRMELLERHLFGVARAS